MKEKRSSFTSRGMRAQFVCRLDIKPTGPTFGNCKKNKKKEMASFVFHTADGTTLCQTIECDECCQLIQKGEKLYNHRRWKMVFVCEFCYLQNKKGYVSVKLK